MFENIIKSRSFVVIISVIWGLGLATLFQKTCKGRHCKIIQYKGPDNNWMNNAVFNYGTNKCYKYVPVINKCPTDI